MKNGLVLKATEGLDYPVELVQTSKHKFTVTYGAEVTKGLLYSHAMTTFSDCVHHSLHCANNCTEG